MTFYRLGTDGSRIDCDGLLGIAGGTDPTAAWLAGGGPSLAGAPLADIQNSPAPIMAVNFAGRGPDGAPPLLRPSLWTTWDPTPRFHRSIFLDPRITKFCQSRFRLDLVPDTGLKVADCPNTLFFDKECRGYGEFLDPSATKLLDCQDSFCQAIDILFRLGYRVLYCVGTDMRIRPSEPQIELARASGVVYENGETVWKHATDDSKEFRSDRLKDFVEECQRKGVGEDRTAVCLAMEKVERESQYSFTESKSFLAAMNTDLHYWRIVQYLRLARRTLSLNGLRIVSCTPDSRLNAFFPFMDAAAAAAAIREQVGDPAEEAVNGRYRGLNQRPALPYMEDLSPHGWKPDKPKDCGCGKAAPAPAQPTEPAAGQVVQDEPPRRVQLLQEVQRMRAQEVAEDA